MCFINVLFVVQTKLVFVKQYPDFHCCISYLSANTGFAHHQLVFFDHINFFILVGIFRRICFRKVMNKLNNLSIGVEVFDYALGGDEDVFANHIYSIRYWFSQEMFTIQRSMV